MAHEILRNFGLSDRVAVVYEDATKYRHPKPIDLLISETMMSALFSEPLVQIMNNLGPQTSAEKRIVPAKIILRARLDDGEAITFDYKPGIDFIEEINIGLPAPQLAKPSALGDRRIRVNIDTEVQVMNGVSLTGRHSDITCRRQIDRDLRCDNEKTTVRLRYKPGCSEHQANLAPDNH
jgi:hypothetical protein